MAITFPYTSPSVQFGTNTYAYQWYGGYYGDQLYTNNSTMTSTGYTTINSITVAADGTRTANITVYMVMATTRSGTDPGGTWTYRSTPNIRLYNTTLGTYITVYNTALSNAVANATTVNTVHSTTVNVSIPASWFYAYNSNWKFDTTNECYITNTGTTYNHTKTEAIFQVPPSFTATVRYNDALMPVKGMWVRYNDTLVEVKDLKVNMDGVIK